MTVATEGPVDASVSVFEDVVERASDTIGNTRRWAIRCISIRISAKE